MIFLKENMISRLTKKCLAIFIQICQTKQNELTCYTRREETHTREISEFYLFCNLRKGQFIFSKISPPARLEQLKESQPISDTESQISISIFQRFFLRARTKRTIFVFKILSLSRTLHPGHIPAKSHTAEKKTQEARSCY